MCLAIPGKILQVTGDDPLYRSGEVDFAGIRKQVSLGMVPEAKIGDYVLVHVGVALQTVDEAEAREIFGYLEQLGETAELSPHDLAGPPPTLPQTHTVPT
jgi:hydrogenase expression/formation protein HypC